MKKELKLWEGMTNPKESLVDILDNLVLLLDRPEFVNNNDGPDYFKCRGCDCFWPTHESERHNKTKKLA